MDQNLQASVTGISTYFKTLAKFDQDIAQADVGYIDGKLKEFREKTTKVQEKLNNDVNTLMGIVEATLTAQLISEIARLASVIVENSNPIKVKSSSSYIESCIKRG